MPPRTQPRRGLDDVFAPFYLCKKRHIFSPKVGGEECGFRERRVSSVAPGLQGRGLATKKRRMCVAVVCGVMVGGLLAGAPSHLLECLGGDAQQFVAVDLGEHGAGWGLYCPTVLPGLSGGGPDHDGCPGNTDVFPYPLEGGLAVATTRTPV